MSWRVTLPCNRFQAEALPEADDLFADSDPPPVLVADEPDPSRPDDWLIHAYFEHEPTPDDLFLLGRLSSSPPEVEQLDDEDWVTRSQAGLQPIQAGRFYVHTPAHSESIPDGAIALEIDAGLAFGTGQHATTAGCLAALDRLERDRARFANVADIGTGTGLLAFAALKLWPDTRAIATDIDPSAIDVARDNALINRVPLGHSPGELLLAVADGMDSEILTDRAPFDLLIANILAGLLDTQAEAVAAAYTERGLTLAHRGKGEWPVLVLQTSDCGV